MNINQLFEQFMGEVSGAATKEGRNSTPLNRLTSGAEGGFASGMATGGVIGLLMGNKKMRKRARKLAGGAIGYGGSAILGAMALKAFQNWQSNRTHPHPGENGMAASSSSLSARFDPACDKDANGQPLQLTLIKSMIAAANADGHIDQQEQAAIFAAIDKMKLDAEFKALIFDVLRNPPSIRQIANYATGLEQATEIYLASRLAIDPDQPSERRYLQELAGSMELPAELVQEIEMQFEAANTPPPPPERMRFGRGVTHPDTGGYR